MPDHDLHVPSAYALATGQAFPRTVMVQDKYGNETRRPLISGDVRYLKNEGRHNDVVYNIIKTPFQDQFASRQRAHSDSQAEYVNDMPRSMQYSPISYIPQAIGMRIGFALRSSPYRTLQFARLANYLICMALFIASIILLPRAKILAVLIASIPTVCFISSSMMPDGFMTALAMFITALALRTIVADTAMGKAPLIAVTVAAALLCCIKVLYLVPLLLVFVLPHHVLALRRKIYMAATLFLTFVAYLVWSKLFSGILYRGNYNDNLRYASHHPIRCITLIVMNIVNGWRDLIPADSSAMIIAIPLIVISIAPLLTGTIRRVPLSEGFIPFAIRHRYAIVTVAGALLAWILVYAFIALTWNDVTVLGSHGYVIGVQGRYALPLFPLLAVPSIYTDRQTESHAHDGD